MDEKTLIALDPTSGPLERKDDRALPARVASLSGHVLGLVANGVGRPTCDTRAAADAPGCTRTPYISSFVTATSTTSNVVSHSIF